MFQLTTKWIAIPTSLYVSLTLICIVAGVYALIALVNGMVKKRKLSYFVLWGIILLLSVTYLVASWGIHVIVANTMIGG